MGVFYSDPEQATGVSEACLAQDQFTTEAISRSALVQDLRVSIRAMSTVIDISTADSIEVTRNFWTMAENKIGFYWDVEFRRQNGDLCTMTCDPTNLVSLDGSSPIVCEVTPRQNGTMISGKFALGQSYPHKYLTNATNVLTNYYSKNMTFNIDATHMADTLSAMHQLPVGALNLGYATVTMPDFLTATKAIQPNNAA